MALLEGVDSSTVRSICKDFAFRRGEKKRMLSYKKISPSIISELNAQKIEPSRTFRLLEPLSYEVIILLQAKHKNTTFRKHILEFLEIYNGMRICVDGDDLTRLGLKPGPHYQRIFNRVLRAKLNGLVSTEEEELRMIKRIIHYK
jgi:tRNA nucleotidyltransferase (CCA-adding enzyme)